MGKEIKNLNLSAEELQGELLIHMGYSSYTKFCMQCVHCQYVKKQAYCCLLPIMKMAVSEEGSCNFFSFT